MRYRTHLVGDEAVLTVGGAEVFRGRYAGSAGQSQMWVGGGATLWLSRDRVVLERDEEVELELRLDE